VTADCLLCRSVINTALSALANARGSRLYANLVDDTNDACDSLRAVNAQLFVVVRGDSSAEGDFATTRRDVDLMSARYLPTNEKIQHAPFQIMIASDHQGLGIADVGRIQGRSVF